jgi:DNA repair protein SbcC/Rad50
MGRFTVVTGPTGSGKSAVIRAIRLLAFNARGTGYVTRGQKSCKVASGDQELAWAIGIERGSRGSDAYRISRLDGSGEPRVDTFTKLAGGVPDAVTQILQLSELNFAGQFDRPYLLDSSGGEIARVLGRLTNVTLLFDAAREANRRRLEIMGDLKRAEASLASLTEQAQRFRGMRERHEAVSEAEAAWSRTQDTSARLVRLQGLAQRLETAQQYMSRSELELAVVPSAGRLDDLAAKLARVRSLEQALGSSRAAAEDAYARAMVAVQEEEVAHVRLHQVLVDAGQCPTCGQEVSAA